MGGMKSLFSLALCLLLTAGTLRAAETVRDVGESFTCYFQNAGDVGKASTDLGGSSSKNWSESEIAAVERALLAWDELITQQPTRRVTVGLYWMDFAAKGRGGSMGGCTVQLVPPSARATGAQQIFVRPEKVWRDGVKLDASRGYDILLCFNTRPGLFYFGAKENKRAIGSQHDFQSVVMHEIGHGLGITSAVRGAGRDGSVIRAVYQKAGSRMFLYTAFDGLMRNTKGERVVDLAAKMMAERGIPSGFTVGETITLAGSSLCIANPPQFKQGSSITHVDKDGALMVSSFMPGSFHRDITRAEQEIMKLLGWEVKGGKADKGGKAKGKKKKRR